VLLLPLSSRCTLNRRASPTPSPQTASATFRTPTRRTPTRRPPSRTAPEDLFQTPIPHLHRARSSTASCTASVFWPFRQSGETKWARRSLHAQALAIQASPIKPLLTLSRLVSMKSARTVFVFRGTYLCRVLPRRSHGMRLRTSTEASCDDGIDAFFREGSEKGKRLTAMDKPRATPTITSIAVRFFAPSTTGGA